MNTRKIAAALLLSAGMPGAAGVSFGATAQYTETEEVVAKPIVKVMRVPVRLDLASAADYAVHALDTAGRRTGEVETTVRDGSLAFVASTRGPDGRGCLAWEVVRK